MKKFVITIFSLALIGVAWSAFAQQATRVWEYYTGDGCPGCIEVGQRFNHDQIAKMGVKVFNNPSEVPSPDGTYPYLRQVENNNLVPGQGFLVPDSIIPQLQKISA